VHSVVVDMDKNKVQHRISGSARRNQSPAVTNIPLALLSDGIEIEKQLLLPCVTGCFTRIEA
jgi:hypothetical protein